MSLHDEIMALECDESESDQFIIGHIEARHAAAALAIKADAEIARLSVALEAAQNALKEAIHDCREAYDKGRADQAVDDLPREIQIAAMSQDAQRLTGENAVLRGLLQDVLSLIRNIECGCWSPEGTDNLRVRIEGALNGQGRYVPSDGQIYAETSRRANPEARLREHFSQVRLDLQPYLAVGGVISGMPETIEALKELLDRGQGPTPKAPEVSDQSAESAPCGTRDHWHYLNSGEDCLICLEIACERERWKRENQESESGGGLPPPRPMYENTD